MKVAVSTIGRFHSIDLARELHARSELVQVLSSYPWSKLANSGLPKELVKTFPYVLAPYTLYLRLSPKDRGLKREWEWAAKKFHDRWVASSIPPVDVVVALSGIGVKTMKEAQRRGIKYVVDRGSSHILFQQSMLEEEYREYGIPTPKIDPRVIAVELEEYEKADAIVIASNFVRRSFVESGIPEDRLRLVPYGVDLTNFTPKGSPPPDSFRVLYVGSIIPRKGIPYLIRAFSALKHPNKTLTIVGHASTEMREIIQKMSPQGCEVKWAGLLGKKEVCEEMSRSHALVLPSVEDGFGLVLAQALASGCPVIGTTNTGVSDLITDGREGFIVPIRDPDAITTKLQLLCDEPDRRREMREAGLQLVKGFGGWSTYGQLMSEALHRVVEA